MGVMSPEVATPFLVALIVFAAALAIPALRRKRLPTPMPPKLAAAVKAEGLAGLGKPVGLVAVMCLLVGTAVAAWPSGTPAPAGTPTPEPVAAFATSTPTLTPAPVLTEPQGSPAPDGDALDGRSGVGR